MSSVRRFLFALIFFGIGINFLILTDINFFFLREIISSIYILLVPGLLLSWIIYLKFSNIWEVITNALGLSLVQLMLLGLSANFLLPYIKFSQPLTLFPILFSFDLLTGALWLYLFIRNKPFPLRPIRLEYSIKQIIITAFPIIFPVLSVVGAINLNNNQTNIFTMLMLGLIAIYTYLLTIFRHKTPEYLYTFSIFTIGLSLLLMTSLRGWFITGHDIYLEYYVFQLTKINGIWSMSNFQNPYTACLSITILPTILTILTHINDLYIYKILYQIIYAFSLVISYQFLKKFLNPFLSFLGTFIIMTTPTFMTDMPMLNRQEIALLFFVLILNTLFTKTLFTKTKWILFTIFGIGLIISHYSTTYVTVGLFMATSIIYLLTNMLQKQSKLKTFVYNIDKKFGIENNKTNIKISMTILLLLVTIAWNFGYTHTADGIIQTLNSVSKDLTTRHFAKSKSDPASYSLIRTNKISPQNLLDTYVVNNTKYTREFNNNSAFFNKAIYSQNKITADRQEILPLTWLGAKLKTLHINLIAFNDSLKQTYAKLIQIFIIIGLISIPLYKKYVRDLHKEHIVLTSVFFLLLVGETIMPGNAIDYGILRLFQQGLILLVIPLLIGMLTFFSFFDKIHKSIKIYISSFIFVFFFLYLSGFTTILAGGYYPSLNLANSGFYYDAYYTHGQELTSINWLSKNRDKRIPIQADWFTGKKIHTYGNFYSVDGLLPSTIRKNSYVYISYSNIQTGNVIVYINGAPVYYKFPFTFLDQNKNLIYNNGGTKIYR